MKNTLSLEAGFMKNHSVTGSGFYIGLSNMLLVQWWESERHILVWLGPEKHKNAQISFIPFQNTMALGVNAIRDIAD